MSRGAQIIIGVIMLALSLVLLMMAAIPGEAGYGVYRVMGALLFAILGFACVFTIGRPLTTRVAMGLLSLFMIIIAVYSASQKDGVKPIMFAVAIAMMSGAYAVTGFYPNDFPLAEVFGTRKKGKRRKK